MSVEETIRAAQTISATINNHMDCLRRSANNLSLQRERVAKLASGSQSGNAAVKLLDGAAITLQKTVSTLSGTVSDLEAFANKVRES